MNEKIVQKLNTAWALNPNIRFGQLVESVEDIAWTMMNQRDFSARLMYLPDHLFEAALDQWINFPFQRKIINS